MKKQLLLVLFILLNSVITAQNITPEKHLQKAFEAVKNNDANAFKSLWPDSKTFSKIIIDSGDFDALTADGIEVYNESRYYRMMGKMLEEFLDMRTMNNEVNWNDLYIKEIYFDKNATKNSEGIIEYSGFIWLKNKAENYALPFVDMIQYKKQWYGGLFRDLKTFDGRFENFIQSEESQETVSPEAEAAALEAAEIAIAAAESAASLVDLPLLEQTVFSATVNGKKMILNWKVNGWIEEPVYNPKYQYQNKEEQSFAEIITLENGYILLVVEDRKGFFRIKNSYGSLSGFWFSTQTNKEVPVTFASTEVKK